VPAGRRAQLQVLLGVARLLVARQRADLPTVVGEARRLGAVAEAPDAAQPGLGGELRALGLISLGVAEVWAGWVEEAERHLEQGVTLAGRIGRPYLEFSGLAYRAMIEIHRASLVRAAERSRQAIELAEQHGWTEELAAGAAYVMLGGVLAWQGRFEEADHWVQRAGRTITAEAEPGTALVLYTSRGVLELVRGQVAEALASFCSAERVAGHLAAPHMLVPPTRALRLLALVRLGEFERAERDLAELGEQDRERGEIRIATAGLRLAQNDPHAAAAALAPVLDGSAPVGWAPWLVGLFLLEAIARDTLGDPAAAGRALEHALDLAEPDGALFFFLIQPAPRLLNRHAGHRTAHASLVAEILDLLGGQGPGPAPGGPRPPLEPLTESEIRVLRYLPTNLSAPEIAAELYLSPNTVKTHMRHLYAKLGTHHRAEAVARARALGLLAPSAHRR
jgi:LuxR family maltose regulon positive regulatory protein